MRLLALILAATAIGTAQTAPGTGTIEGQVTSLTGEPLRKATVLLLRGGSTDPPANGGAVTTGSDGKFVFENIQFGSYMLLGSRTGYLTQRYGTLAPDVEPHQPFGKLIEVQSGSRLTAINLVLTPQSIISGRILDEDGDALGTADVAIYKIVWPGGTKQLMRLGRGVVNPDASYMAGNLPPGRYYVAAASPALPDAHEAYLETFFPRTTDVAASIPIDIGPGEQIHNIDLRLIRGPLFRIRGRVSGTLVGSGSNVVLELAPRRSVAAAGPGTQGKVASVAPDGAFSFESVAPGLYVIQSGLSTAVAHVPVTVTDHDIDDLAVAIGSGLTLTGSVKAEDGVAAGSMLLVLQSTEDSFRVVNTMFETNGQLEIRELRPEVYRFTFGGLTADTWIKEVRFGGAVITGDNLDLTNESGTSLQILLGAHAASVGGVVRNGEGDPMANVPVAVWPASGEGATRVMTTGIDGRFQFASLAPGDYQVTAWEQLEDGLAQNREFRMRFEGAAMKISLGESAHQEVELTAVSKGVTEVAIRALY